MFLISTLHSPLSTLNSALKEGVFIKAISNFFSRFRLVLRRFFGKIFSKRAFGGRFFARLIGLLIVISLLVSLCAYVHKKAGPYAISALENVVVGDIEESVASVAKEILEGGSYTWDDFYNKSIGSDGSVSAIYSNSGVSNKVCVEVLSALRGKYAEKKYINIPVPLGSVLSPEYFSGKGPYVMVRAVPYISFSASIESSAEGSGINQTLHKIKLKIVSDASVICMSESRKFRVESEILLAETLIVGKIPVISG